MTGGVRAEDFGADSSAGAWVDDEWAGATGGGSMVGGWGGVSPSNDET